jgi:diguanylate cyclase (GGDEF)-like protein/PAS domain S-box-containing protein
VKEVSLMIRHIVLWRLADIARGQRRDDNAREVKRLLEGLRGRIPGLLRLEVGFNVVPSADAADIALDSEFESQEALDAYQSHPLHQAVMPFVRDVRTERRSVDYEISSLPFDALRHLGVGVVLLDKAGLVAYSNEAAAEFLGLPADGVSGRILFDNPALPRELMELQGPFWTAMADGLESLDLEREFTVRTAGGRREVRAHLTRIDHADEAFGLLRLEDNERIKRVERALSAALGEAEERALRDPLTGLFNRRHIEPALVAELSRAGRMESPLSFVAIDLDHFKQVNDRFGHATGDRVLVEFSRLLGRILRVGDTPGRLGGEEFCVLLPHTDTTAAERAAERLHRVVRALRFQEEPDLRVSISMGLATVRPEAISPNLAGEAARLLARADEALYRAKEAGRDRTVVAAS